MLPSGHVTIVPGCAGGGDRRGQAGTGTKLIAADQSSRASRDALRIHPRGYGELWTPRVRLVNSH